MESIGHNALDKSHLIFKWNCEYHTSLTSDIWMDCNEMFNGMDDQAMSYVYFNTQNIIENEYYIYKYTLDVMDVNNNKRYFVALILILSSCNDDIIWIFHRININFIVII